MARTRPLGGRLLLLAVLAAVLALHHAPPSCAAWSELPALSISAAPEYPPLPRLPRQHGHHPHSALPPAALALSPDIMPVLPSPAEDGAAAPPSDAEPTIPSSPSPPNPDALEPNSAFAPSGYAPAVAAQSPAPPPARAATVAWALPVVALLAMWSV
ncbi:hypothetical protein SEVIR_5G452700v4 [Setaria viridis]|uniref:Uncharacterized protein n=1 Tax=Setaria viridis TaxID=4556 RepID=A0A4U6UQW6_SETVI|nr:vegetative cell wall protein gp1-like [Setaria viridis]TKW18758.1 hypothetical protein SEVIR_5G452700v2 [Setaria viridis]